MKNILIIGKSGLIGKRISEIITERNLGYTIYSGGRNVSTETRHFEIDVYRKETLNQIKPANIDLVVLCTVDKEDNVLRFCIENSIDYLDITKPTEDLKRAYEIANLSRVNSRIVFASGWMGGIVGALIPNYISINELKLYIYYSLEDVSGKSSVDFLAENITSPFPLYVNNQPKLVRYFRGSEKHQFKFDQKTRMVYNFDLPDLYILNTSRKIPSVSAKIAYNSSWAMFAIRVGLSLGLFSILSVDTRKKLFRSSGKGDTTSFDISYNTNKGKEQHRISIECTKGQAELTSLATVLNIEKLFQKDKGVYFAYEMYSKLELHGLLKKNGFINIR